MGNRAWKYCRQASPDAMLTGLAAQDSFIERRAAAWGLHIVGETKAVEPGLSADRDSIRELLDKAEAGAYDILLISGMDRLSRNLWDTVEILSKLLATGIRVRDARTGEEITKV